MEDTDVAIIMARLDVIDSHELHLGRVVDKMKREIIGLNAQFSLMQSTLLDKLQVYKVIQDD